MVGVCQAVKGKEDFSTEQDLPGNGKSCSTRNDKPLASTLGATLETVFRI